MKVLFVSSGNIKGGKPTNLILAQGQSLIDQGVDVTFFPIMGKGPIGYLKNIKRIKKFLKTQEFDIIHAHYGFCGIVAYFAKTNQKIVISLMGSDILGDVNPKKIDKIKNAALIFLVKFFSKYLLDFTIVKSENLALKLWKNTPHKIIPNGVDFSIFFPMDKKSARETLNLSFEKTIILFPTDKIRQEKNFSLAEKAFKLLNKQNSELITVHGISQERLNLYYNAADVLLMTSIYEGSPNVIKEGLACNMVIVSTDVGDVKKNLATVEGCFVTSYDPKDIADKIDKSILVSKSNGREKILHLDCREIAQQIIAIYRQLKN